MSETTYTSHTWTDGEIITADLMNHLEQGIADISAAISTAQINYPALNSRVETLETSNTNITNRVDSLESSVSTLELNQIGTDGVVEYTDQTSSIIDVAESQMKIYNIGKFALLYYEIRFNSVTTPYMTFATVSEGYETYGGDAYTMPGSPFTIVGNLIWLEGNTYSGSSKVCGTIPYLINPDSTNESQGEDSNA